MKSKWYIIIIGAVLLWTAFSRYIRTRTGKRQWDWVKLRIPVFGKLNHKVAIARFSRTLGTLLVSGVPILQALETVAGAIDNEIISDAVMAARAAIREGERIGDPLAKSGLFPPMVVQMISIGEETGSLDAMLSKVADFYESEVEATLQSLTAALEPVMIVLLGGIVGFIVISMFLPLIHHQRVGGRGRGVIAPAWRMQSSPSSRSPSAQPWGASSTSASTDCRGTSLSSSRPRTARRAASACARSTSSRCSASSPSGANAATAASPSVGATSWSS